MKRCFVVVLFLFLFLFILLLLRVVDILFSVSVSGSVELCRRKLMLSVSLHSVVLAVCLFVQSWHRAGPHRPVA